MFLTHNPNNWGVVIPRTYVTLSKRKSNTLWGFRPVYLLFVLLKRHIACFALFAVTVCHPWELNVFKGRERWVSVTAQLRTTLPQANNQSTGHRGGGVVTASTVYQPGTDLFISFSYRRDKNSEKVGDSLQGHISRTYIFSFSRSVEYRVDFLKP